MPYDVKNFLKMASMFGQERELNPTLIPPELNSQPPPMAPFAQTPQMAPPEGPAEPQGSPLPDFQPEMRASNRAYEMLDQIPQPQTPGIGRKIGASLVSLGVSPQASERALYGPYHTAMDQWRDKFGPTIQAANQERYYNTNMRQWYDSNRRQDIAQQRADTAADRARTYDEVQRGKLELAQKQLQFKQDVENWKQANPKGKVEILRDGSIALVYDDGRVLNTGEKSKDYDAVTLANLRSQNRIKEIGAQGEQSRETERLRQQGFGPPVQIFMPNGQPMAPYQFNKAGGARPVPGLPEGAYLRDQPPGSSTSGDTLPLETPDAQRKRWQNNAAFYLQQHPEDADFIEFSLDNPEAFPKVKEAGTSSGGSWNPMNWGAGANVLTPEKKAQIEAAIFGEGKQQTTRITKSGMKPTPSHETTAPKAPPGWKYVPKPGGGWTAVEDKK